MDKELRVGDKVTLQIRASARPVGVTPGLLALNGKIFSVARIRVVKVAEASTNRGTYYELKGCESARGVPFAVLREWLQPV